MHTVLSALKKYFLSGVLVVVPVILTFLVLQFLFQTVDDILRPLLSNLLGYYVTGLGLLTTLLIVLLAGVLTRNFIGHRLYRLWEKLLERMPFIRPIYSASKQLLEALTRTDKGSFNEVALIQYPRRGLWTLCFVSQRVDIRVEGQQSGRHATCFVPSTPTPVSGMVVMVPEAEVFLLDMTIEQGIKFVVSGGVASPSMLKQKSTASSPTRSEV